MVDKSGNKSIIHHSRLKEIIRLAHKLGWILPIPRPNPNNYSYPLMQLSEVEKCMIALYDNEYLNRMRMWAGEEQIIEN